MKKYILAITLFAILSASACGSEKVSTQAEDIVAAPVGTVISSLEEETATETTTMTFATTTTEVTTEAEVTTWSVTTTTPETTAPEVPDTPCPLGEKYIETLPIAPESHDIIMQATKDFVNQDNVAIRSIAYSDGVPFTSIEIAHNETGDKIYKVSLMTVNTNVLLKSDGTAYIFDDNEKFYVNITDNPNVDLEAIKQQGDLQLDYNVIDSTMDTVLLDGDRFMRMHATYDIEGVDQEYTLYFNAETGFLTYIYAEVPMFGATTSKMEYKAADDSYFNFIDKYAEFSFDQYQEFMQKQLSKVEVD